MRIRGREEEMERGKKGKNECMNELAGMSGLSEKNNPRKGNRIKYVMREKEKEGNRQTNTHKRRHKKKETDLNRHRSINIHKRR